MARVNHPRSLPVTIAEVAFANPFAENFPHLLEQAEGCASYVQALEQAGKAHLRHYQAPSSRETMRLVFLFDAYQRARHRLDELIAAQITAGDTPAPVPFARETLHLLTERGFEENDALRSLALFYQIRRAYHFIAEGLVGSSPCMREFRRHLWNNVFTHDIRHYEQALWHRMEDFSTLLLGETGTGKGAAAAAIGRSGFIPFDARRQHFAESFTRTFVALNLTQFPETLLESELFGHRKGAFTGAVDSHQGILSRCSPHGAIFLDEIGEVPPHVQVKLLRVLQDRQFSPVGSRETFRFRGRVIAATNRPLTELRGLHGFRDDFFYRLCSDVITVPPLRQRLEEDPAELTALLEVIAQRIAGGGARQLLPALNQGLRPLQQAHYHWPGNVRELEQAARRILLTRHYHGEEPAGTGNDFENLAGALHHGNASADQLLHWYCRHLYTRHRNLEEVARRTCLDRRTVKRYLALPHPQLN